MERQEIRRGQVGKIAKVRRGKVENRAGDSWQEGRGQEGTSGMECRGLERKWQRGKRFLWE
jgi:hypothetical protein